MKKLSVICCLLLPIFLFSSLSAQISIKLEINHKLGTSPFAMNQMAQNSLGQDFDINNLRYYLSGFSITHDSGKVAEMPDLIFFIDAPEPVLLDLGVHNLGEIEAISFHMGVDSARNHLDPAAYPESHPLALKDPSMHWGWASGYFFLSLNGQSGLNLRSNFDLQCLGDENYFQTVVENPLVTDYSDEVLISIDADYSGLLHQMDISQSISMHGPFLWAQQALVNASLRVFKPSLAPVYMAIDELESPFPFSLFPNPLQRGQKLTLTADQQEGEISWNLYDLTGREIRKQEHVPVGTACTIYCHQRGIFILKVFQGAELLGARKVVVE